MPTATRFEWFYATCLLAIMLSIAFVVSDQPIGESSLNPVKSLELVSSVGDQHKQTILLGSYLGTLLLLLFRARLRLWLFLGVPLLASTLWAFATVTWSHDPALSLRRCVALLGTVLFGLLLGLRFDFRAMLRLLSITAGIVLLGSLAWAAIDPLHGLDPERRLRGVFVHKNGIGNFSALIFLVSMGQLALRHYATGIFFATLTIGCMIFAHSSAVVVVVIAGLAMMLIASFFAAADSEVRAFLPLAACLLIVGIAVAVQYHDSVTAMLGRDSDISGRTFVWAFVLDRIADHPWLGFGFGTFWTGNNSPGAVFWENTNLGVPHAHNGYLQLALDAGGIGLLLFCVALTMVVGRLFWLLRHTQQPLIPWALGYLSFFLVTNMSESMLWLGNETLTTLFVYVAVRTSMMMREVNVAYRIRFLSGSVEKLA